MGSLCEASVGVIVGGILGSTEGKDASVGIIVGEILGSTDGTTVGGVFCSRDRAESCNSSWWAIRCTTSVRNRNLIHQFTVSMGVSKIYAIKE